jgi:hypothetical protein
MLAARHEGWYHHLGACTVLQSGIRLVQQPESGTTIIAERVWRSCFWAGEALAAALACLLCCCGSATSSCQLLSGYGCKGEGYMYAYHKRRYARRACDGVNRWFGSHDRIVSVGPAEVVPGVPMARHLLLTLLQCHVGIISRVACRMCVYSSLPCALDTGWTHHAVARISY